MLEEFFNYLCYQNPYNPAPNGNRLYLIESFDHYFSLEVSVNPDGSFRLVDWLVID